MNKESLIGFVAKNSTFGVNAPNASSQEPLHEEVINHIKYLESL